MFWDHWAETLSFQSFKGLLTSLVWTLICFLSRGYDFIYLISSSLCRNCLKVMQELYKYANLNSLAWNFSCWTSAWVLGGILLEGIFQQSIFTHFQEQVIHLHVLLGTKHYDIVSCCTIPAVWDCLCQGWSFCSSKNETQVRKLEVGKRKRHESNRERKESTAEGYEYKFHIPAMPMILLKLAQKVLVNKLFVTPYNQDIF